MEAALILKNPPSAELYNERELILDCQRGVKQAYGPLVKKYMKRAYYTALGLIGSPEAAMDLSQEAFIRAYRAIKRLDADKKFFTWYYRILKNLCLNYLRDRARHARPFSEVGETTVMKLSDTEQDAFQQVARKETREAVWHAINALKPAEKEIIILKDFQDHSYKEIAELLDCPIGTVMSRLYNARQALKSKLEKVFL